MRSEFEGSDGFPKEIKAEYEQVLTAIAEAEQI
jgi:hypothetical protein